MIPRALLVKGWILVLMGVSLAQDYDVQVTWLLVRSASISQSPSRNEHSDEEVIFTIAARPNVVLRINGYRSAQVTSSVRLYSAYRSQFPLYIESSEGCTMQVTYEELVSKGFHLEIHRPFRDRECVGGT